MHLELNVKNQWFICQEVLEVDACYVFGFFSRSYQRTRRAVPATQPSPRTILSLATSAT